MHFTELNGTRKPASYGCYLPIFKMDSTGYILQCMYIFTFRLGIIKSIKITRTLCVNLNYEEPVEENFTKTNYALIDLQFHF